MALRPPPLDAISPTDAGLSDASLARMRDVLGREVEAGRLPGAVVGILRGGGLADLSAVGYSDAIARAPMQRDGVFSIASMTKPMVSVLVMQLVEEGRLLLGDPIGQHLPELAEMRVQTRDGDGRYNVVAAERSPTIQDLLRHTSGLTYSDRGTTPAHAKAPGASIGASIRLSRSEFMSAIAATPLLFQPGTSWEYGFSTDILGLLVERLTDKPLGDVMSERLWQPLGMRETGFTVSPDQGERYARAFPIDPLTGAEQSVAHASGAAFKWQSGGGGGVSTAGDYLRFLRMLLSEGQLSDSPEPEVGGERLLSRASVALMTSDHLAPGVPSRIADTMDPAAEGYGFGLGFAVRRQDGVSALHGSEGDYYWSGVYGTYFWVDPSEDLAVVFMAATPGPIRLRYRQLIRALVYQALVD